MSKYIIIFCFNKFDVKFFLKFTQNYDIIQSPKTARRTFYKDLCLFKELAFEFKKPM